MSTVSLHDFNFMFKGIDRRNSIYLFLSLVFSHPKSVNMQKFFSLFYNWKVKNAYKNDKRYLNDLYINFIT